MRTDSKQSMYIETTIPSLVAANQSRDTISAAHQLITKNFWENERYKYDLYISQYVIDECAKGDSDAAKKRLELIAGIPLLPETQEVWELGAVYKRVLNIPDRARVDAFHLAAAVIGKMDYLISWNFIHMGVLAHKKLLEYNNGKGLKTPLLINPEFFMNTRE